MTSKNNLRSISRGTWDVVYENGPDFQVINSGSFQRIADSLEKLAARPDPLAQVIRDRDRYQRLYRNALKKLKAKR